MTIFLSRQLSTARAVGIALARWLWRQTKRATAVLHAQLLFLIILVPLVLGFFAGLSYGLIRRWWAALLVGLESGDQFINGQPHD